MTQRIFLPARRGGRTLVFEHRELAEKRRWEFVAIAVLTPEGDCRRAGTGPLTRAELKHCADVAAQLEQLEAAAGQLGLFDLDVAAAALQLPAEAAVVEGSALLTLTLYLQLLRDTLVTAASVARYRARPVAERVEPGLSSSLYVTLIKEGNTATAAALFDEDRVAVPAKLPRSRDWGYFFGQAAMALEAEGRTADALAMCRRGVACWPSDAMWRRIGNLEEAAGHRSAAIDAFEAAEKLKPLAAKPTLRLARWLQTDGRTGDARAMAQRALDRGAEEAQAFLDALP